MEHAVETFADTAIVVDVDAAKLEPVNAINAAAMERLIRDLLDTANSCGVEANLAAFEQLICSLANRAGPTNNPSFISFQAPGTSVCVKTDFGSRLRREIPRGDQTT
jgi:hypothetical protein